MAFEKISPVMHEEWIERWSEASVRVLVRAGEGLSHCRGGRNGHERTHLRGRT
jgi:hypothetical protein